MLRKADVVGKRIQRLLRTPYKDTPSPDMPAGPIWSYCALYVELHDGVLFELKPEELVRAAKALPEWIEIEESALCRGEEIRGVIVSEHDELLIVLPNGRYLQDDTPVGGNRLALESFEEWSPEYRAGRFLDYWEKTPVVP